MTTGTGGSEARAGAGAAVFLDRDGTLIEEGELIERPEQVVLLPGVAAAIARLRAAGYAAIVVTNQSAIGRGLLDEARLARVHEALETALRAGGTQLDGIYFAPDLPDSDSDSDPERERTEPLARRKPGAGMLLQAAREHGLRLSRCWMVGDQMRDVIAGRRAGCRGSLLVRTGRTPVARAKEVGADGSFEDLSAAVEYILASDAVDPLARVAESDGRRPREQSD